mgnify:CR=1 FL=1
MLLFLRCEIGNSLFFVHNCSHPVYFDFTAQTLSVSHSTGGYFGLGGYEKAKHWSPVNWVPLAEKSKRSKFYYIGMYVVGDRLVCSFIDIGDGEGVEFEFDFDFDLGCCCCGCCCNFYVAVPTAVHVDGEDVGATAEDLRSKDGGTFIDSGTTFSFVQFASLFVCGYCGAIALLMFMLVLAVMMMVMSIPQVHSDGLMDESQRKI